MITHQTINSLPNEFGPKSGAPRDGNAVLHFACSRQSLTGRFDQAPLLHLGGLILWLYDRRGVSRQCALDAHGGYAQRSGPRRRAEVTVHVRMCALKFGDQRFESIHDARVKLRTAVFVYLSQCCCDRHWEPVGLRMRHRVKGVAHGDDPRGQWDRALHQTFGIPGSVESLMVKARDVGRQLAQRVIAASRSCRRQISSFWKPKASGTTARASDAGPVETAEIRSIVPSIALTLAGEPMHACSRRRRDGRFEANCTAAMTDRNWPAG